MPHSSSVALVTGAAQGIGRAIATRLLHEGWTVWAFDLDDAALADLKARQADDIPGTLITHAGDVACEPDVQALVEAITQRSGRLELLVNNAGLAGPDNGPIESLALADWQRVIDVNLTGMFLATKHATPLLRAGQGTIVNMTSSRAFQSEPDTEAYAASKGGIHALTHALAMSLGPAIRVNAIAPGWIDVRDQQAGTTTVDALRDIDDDQHPVGRVGRGEDIAGLVSFLAGPDAGFITGQTLVADGGMTTKMIYAH